jgi:hypothetical protein
MLALVATAAVMLAAAASGGQVFRETIHDESTRVENPFCDDPDMTVQVESVVDIRVQAVPHGRDRLAYFLSHGIRTETLANLDNDKSLTSVASVIEKDMRVTDNGDGTLTVLILATGNSVLYGEDGKAIARNPGQTRFEIVFGPDDEVLDFRVVKESTGRSDDFCEAAVAALS